jgi:hypothetical protein
MQQAVETVGIGEQSIECIFFKKGKLLTGNGAGQEFFAICL